MLVCTSAKSGDNLSFHDNNNNYKCYETALHVVDVVQKKVDERQKINDMGQKGSTVAESQNLSGPR